MGYRLVLREAYVYAKDGILEFKGKIQNVGFGNVINEKRVTVLLQPKAGGECFTADTNLDPRDWLVAHDGNSRPDSTAAWRDLSFAIKLNELGKMPPGEYNIYLKINDPKETSKNKRCIRFANYDMWDAALGANMVGEVAIV